MLCEKKGEGRMIEGYQEIYYVLVFSLTGPSGPDLAKA